MTWHLIVASIFMTLLFIGILPLCILWGAFKGIWEEVAEWFNTIKGFWEA